MTERRDFSISEFARLSGITRKNLIFYDEAGILHPERIERNGYRRYHWRQLPVAFVIISLRSMGLPLEEIRRFLEKRSPARMRAFFAEQEKNLEKEERRLRNIRETMRILTAQAEIAADAKVDSVGLEELPREQLFVAAEMAPCGEAGATEASVEIYEWAKAADMSPALPFGIVAPGEVFLGGRWEDGIRLYLKSPDGAETRPAGLYAVAYGRSENILCRPAIERLRRFIKQNALSPCGDFYQEVLLGELSVQSLDRFLYRTMIGVRRKGKRRS